MGRWRRVDRNFPLVGGDEEGKGRGSVGESERKGRGRKGKGRCDAQRNVKGILKGKVSVCIKI